MEKSMTISEQIDKEYRKYALYVIQSRGIPNFYDALTPVQRLILQNAPTNFKKTVGVIGEVFSTGLYHHGDSSIAQAISKLARPFLCSDQILIGDGFFGSPVNPTPSAPRYTQVKIAPKYKGIIEKYKDLNIPNEEGGYDWIHVDYPIGLSTHIVGIAVGYKSNILPRRPEDIIDYLDGNRSKRLKPYFKGFKGRITRVDSLKSAWLIEGEAEIDISTKTLKIHSLPPLHRYEHFFNRLNIILEKSGLAYKMENFSTENVEIHLKFRCTDQEFKQISESILKETKQIVTENIIFVRDGSIVKYENLEDYLDDFKVHRERIFLKRFEKDLFYLQNELDFLDAKLKFLAFMSEKKRTTKDVDEFLSGFKKEISKRLGDISLIKLTKEEINNTKEEIKQKENDIKEKKEMIEKQKNKLKGIEKDYASRNKNNNHKTTILLGDDHQEKYYNGIKIWDPEEELRYEEAESIINDNIEE